MTSFRYSLDAHARSESPACRRSSWVDDRRHPMRLMSQFGPDLPGSGIHRPYCAIWHHDMWMHRAFATPLRATFVVRQ
ncbi:hypothetical protein D779_3777 [Imhoffiella purpurea]|uniref:Uncharacterized protein n=1 Tax=Imhoffiella purpurea TaxID=1249627 RepID=W9V952_9GAMM|nr:hypothetical protein D779_3777 [Imhoffiella purpurea]